ncbi:MAG: TIGR03986 family CRISPR-associated RAMP protein, partial [Gammaproteobacteria bacterium]
PTTTLNEAVIRRFLDIYQTGDAKDSWDYWYKQLKSGRGNAVPVFWLGEVDNKNGNHDIKNIGLSQMFRLPYDHTIGEILDNSHPQHRQKDQQTLNFDLCDLLFGTLAEHDDSRAINLKGRVSFSLATLSGKATPAPPKDTILNGPKPSYYPSYIDQNNRGGDRTGNYITLMDAKAQLRGYKRYPVRPMEKSVFPEPNEKNKKVNVQLNPLAPHCTFTGKIRLHNVREVELGALLWALEWGGNAGLSHALGMGKPGGYGQIRIQVNDLSGLKHNQGHPVQPAEHYRELFETWMNQFCKKQMGIAWRETEQLRQLIAMADVEQAKRPIKLEPMTLDSKDFINAKKKENMSVLPAYVNVVQHKAQSPGECFVAALTTEALAADKADAQQEQEKEALIKRIDDCLQKISELPEEYQSLRVLELCWEKSKLTGAPELADRLRSDLAPLIKKPASEEADYRQRLQQLALSFYEDNNWPNNKAKKRERRAL